jgi:two-component system sensor histidine kinase/response regulator
MKKILVVDDDEALLNVLVTALQRNRYVAFAAPDGRVGLQMARDHLPDLVVSDVEMPRMNGRELLAALRADLATATVPFIMMTGQPDRTSMRQGMQMGADDYLPKPFPMAEMLEAIKIRLQRHQQIRDLAVSKIAQIRDSLRTTLPHELLTPLTGVLGFAEILTLDYATLQPSEILEMASEIQESGHRLLRLVQNYMLHMELDVLALDQSRGKSNADRFTSSIAPLSLAGPTICCWKSQIVPSVFPKIGLRKSSKN